MTRTTSSSWRWLRRLLFLLTGTVAAAALLLAGVLLVLDDTDYKRLLIRAADTFLDTELEIAGPFSVKLSDGIQITAGDIRLSAHDGSYMATTREFSTRFRVISIFSGAFEINDLELNDAYLRINETDSGDGFSPADFPILPIVVARAHFRNLQFEYQEAQPGTLHSFYLNELVVDDVNDAGPLAIKANGLLKEHPYELSGTLPPLADMLEADKPHPVEIVFNSEHITARLDGHVADFIKGLGLDLKLEFHAQDVQDILEIFADGIPRVGDLDATARLHGDYDSPGLDSIIVSLHRDDEVAVRVTGTVDDILTGKGLDLDISGHSSQPSVASWLVFGRLDRISTLRLETKVEAHYGRIQLHDVTATASTGDGLELSASGNAELYDSGHVFARSDTGITVKFTAPTTAAVNLLDYKGVPELGAVDGTVRLLASRDAIGLYDAEVRIGSRRGQQSFLQGSVARIGLFGEAAVTGIDLQATLRAPDVAALAKLAGYDLPPVGQGQAELHASGNLNRLRLSNVNVRVGNADAVLLTARGTADRLDLTRESLPESADFSVTLSTPQLAELSGFLDVKLPALARTHATGKLQLRGNRLQFEPVKVDIGAADQPAIRLAGKATTLLRKGSSIDASFDVAATDLLMAFTALKPGYLGRLKGSFSLSSMDGSWGFSEFSLTSAQTQLYQIDINGTRDNFKKTDLVNVKTAISISNPEALGKALNLDLSGISAWSTKGVLSSKADMLSYHATGTLGSTTSTTDISGYLRDGKPHFTGKMEIPVLYLQDLGFRKEPEQQAGKPVSARQDRNYIFSRESLNISMLKRFDLDFDLLIHQIESHDQLSIDSVNGKINVRDGRLGISPLKLVFEGGQMNIQFEADARGVPAYRLQITGDDIVLGPLMAQVQNDVPITGYSNIDMDLSARGRSPHDLVSSLGGNLSIGLENAKIPSEYVELLSVDVFGWAFSKTARKESYTNLNCVVVAFDLKDGYMNSRTLLADGPDLTVAGHINLDLDNETMDILLVPKQKKRVFSSIEPVKIKGPIMDPRVEAVPVKAAIQEVGAMVLLPTVVIPVRLLGKLWSILDDGDKPGQGCASLQSVTEAAEKKLEK
jgi:uncharacterized protein involved in outer membrane biogenesis